MTSDRRGFIRDLAAAGAAGAVLPSAQARTEGRRAAGEEDRRYWLSVLRRVAHPVLLHLARRQLKEKMPVECAPGRLSDRRQYTHLEALGRTLTGIAPWLESSQLTGEEGQLR